jgi:hypothetical protein
MDPYHVHRVGFNHTSRPIDRTFVKMTVSTEILNRVGNTHNPLFKYNWPMIPRSAEKRNHANIVYEPLNKEGFIFNQYDQQQLQDLFEKSPLKMAFKQSKVQAVPADQDELLQTVDDDFTTTINRGKVGDWKVTTERGSEYFLSKEEFDEFYDHVKDTIFKSKPRVVEYVVLDNYIKFTAPWGRMQFLRPGDLLIRRGSEFYGALQSDFLHSYKLIGDRSGSLNDLLGHH